MGAGTRRQEAVALPMERSVCRTPIEGGFGQKVTVLIKKQGRPWPVR